MGKCKTKRCVGLTNHWKPTRHRIDFVPDVVPGGFEGPDFGKKHAYAGGEASAEIICNRHNADIDALTAELERVKARAESAERQRDAIIAMLEQEAKVLAGANDEDEFRANARLARAVAIREGSHE